MNAYGVTAPPKDEQPPLHPQFNDQGGWGSRFKKWIQKNFNRVVLPLLAILIIAAGFYVYLNQQQEQSELITKRDTETEEKETVSNNETEEEQKLEITLSEEGLVEKESEASKVEIEETVAETNTEPKTTKENKEEASSPTNTSVTVTDSEKITIKAKRGDGITHLARKAAREYKEANDVGFNIEKEHLIFVEDYLKDQQGSRMLKIGEELTFNQSDIKKAFEAANNLSDGQLRNLSQYTSAINF